MLNVNNKPVILLIGGTGTFGQAFTKLALDTISNVTIRIFSRGESLQLDMQTKFKDDRLRFFIGDIRDKDRLHRAMSKVDLVIHAAALKQVPTCEYNPIEAVKTNILGSINVIDVAIDNKVPKVIALSSDKCCQPLNLYGATKMCMEKLLVQANVYSPTKFSCVRYGNVIGSRGSVIPIWKEQAKTGKITITDKKMTRFWITVEQAACFVKNCEHIMQGGEIFVPILKSVNIMDLANIISPEAEKDIIGTRPGEKMEETLISMEEGWRTKELPDMYIIEPDSTFIEYKSIGKKVSGGFTYNSRSNLKLREDEIREMLK